MNDLVDIVVKNGFDFVVLAKRLNLPVCDLFQRFNNASFSKAELQLIKKIIKEAHIKEIERIEDFINATDK